jgi:hypothetical protein
MSLCRVYSGEEGDPLHMTEEINPEYDLMLVEAIQKAKRSGKRFDPNTLPEPVRHYYNHRVTVNRMGNHDIETAAVHRRQQDIYDTRSKTRKTLPQPNRGLRERLIRAGCPYGVPFKGDS